MTTRTVTTDASNRLSITAAFLGGEFFYHDAADGRPEFIAPPAPQPFTLIVPEPASNLAQDQFGIGSQVLGNYRLTAVLRVPPGASANVIASSSAGITGYAFDRRKGDNSPSNRLTRPTAVPIVPTRQKAGLAVQSGGGLTPLYGFAAPATFEISASPLARDIVIMGGGDLSVEVFTDSRPNQEFAYPNTQINLPLRPYNTEGGPGLPYPIAHVRRLLGAAPWFVVPSFASSVGQPGAISPYVDTFDRGTVLPDGTPVLNGGSYGDVYPWSLEHMLLSHLLQEAEAPFASHAFSLIGICFAPDAPFTFANAAVAPATGPTAKDLFSNFEATYTPGVSTTFTNTHAFASVGATN